MPEYILLPNAVTESTLRALCDAALQSSYIGHSPLTGTFLASRGFAITMQCSGMAELERRFAFLAAFARLSIGSDTGLWPAPLRAWRRLIGSTPNAFYLNLLLVPPTARIGAHVDATLTSITGVQGLIPRLVSVLYLQCGSDGGELVLTRNDQPVGRITPRPGMLVHFRGDLTHAVDVVKSDTLRASLVLEQYVLPESLLQRLAQFSVHSRGRFRACLDEVRRRPIKAFSIDGDLQARGRFPTQARPEGLSGPGSAGPE